jgi:hypothetical protein
MNISPPSSESKKQRKIPAWKQVASLGSRWYFARLIGPWRWSWYVPPKRRLTFNSLHGVIFYKIVTLNTSDIPYADEKLKHTSIYTELFFRKVACTGHDLSWFVELIYYNFFTFRLVKALSNKSAKQRKRRRILELDPSFSALRSLRQRLWSVLPSGMWHRAVR